MARSNTRKSIMKTANTAIGSKYASKFVAQIVDQLSQKELKAVIKNPKTVKKWLQKLKLSVTKKVSACSRDSFSPVDMTLEYYESEYQRYSSLILQQMKQIKEIESTVPEIPTTTTSNPSEFVAVKSAAFESSTALEALGTKLLKVSTDMKNRTEAFQTTISAVEKGWSEYKQQMLTGLVGPDASNTATSTSTENSMPSSSLSLSGPREALYHHVRSP